MDSLSLCPEFETNLMLNRKVIELLLQLRSAKAHGKNYIKVKLPLVRHLLRYSLLINLNSFYVCNFSVFKYKSRMCRFLVVSSYLHLLISFEHYFVTWF